MNLISDISFFERAKTLCRFLKFTIMAKGKMLTDSEKSQIVKLLALKKSTLEISKELKRDHRTIKSFVNEGKSERKKHKKGRPRVTTARDLRKIKRSLSENPHSTSKTIFDQAGVTNTSKSTRNRILKQMADQRSPTKCPPLSDVNCKKRLSWATKGVLRGPHLGGHTVSEIFDLPFVSGFDCGCFSKY